MMTKQKVQRVYPCLQAMTMTLATSGQEIKDILTKVTAAALSTFSR